MVCVPAAIRAAAAPAMAMRTHLARVGFLLSLIGSPVRHAALVRHDLRLLLRRVAVLARFFFDFPILLIKRSGVE